MLRNCVRKSSTLAVLVNAGVRPSAKAVPKEVGPNRKGIFGISQLVDPIGFETLTEKAITQTELLKEKIIESGNAPNSKANVVQLMDDMSDALCQVADMAEFVRLAHPESEYRRHAQNCCMKIGRYVEELNTDARLYNAVKAKVSTMKDETDRRVGQLFLHDFEQSGIHLPEEQRKAFVAASEQILTLGSLFQQHVDMPNVVNVDKVPKDVLSTLSRHFDFDQSSNSLIIDRFLGDSSDPQVRETSYRLFYSKIPQVDDIIHLLLKQRYELSQLTGFNNFAERTISSNTLAGNVQFVRDVLRYVSEEIAKPAEKELANLKTAMKNDGIDKPLAPWDIYYYAKKMQHQVHEEEVSKVKELKDFLSLGCIISGLDQLFGKLYGVNLVLELSEEGEVWSDEVLKLNVIETSTGDSIGKVYLDLFERPAKPAMDCHFTIRGGRRLPDGSYQHPIVVLMLNFQKPSGSLPAFLSLGQIENLFHEFGHAMHSILGRTKYQHVTGTRCPTDFAEVPSVLMESFASDPRIASLYARHYDSGRAAPAEAMSSVLQGMRKSFRLIDLQQQLVYTDFDLSVHSGPPPMSSELSTEYSKLWQHHCGTEMPTDVAQYQRFAHMVGYGARYYSVCRRCCCISEA